MDPTRTGSAAVHLTGPRELRDWLAGKRIPVDRWGKGSAKRVTDLWSELDSGESVLTDPPLERHLSFVSLVIRKGGRRLTETGQLLATGETRRRDWPPGEKMHPGEDAVAAALRCVEEELGVSRASCRIVRRASEESTEEKVSPSYPGLLTRYSMHQVEMEIDNLPETAFTTVEAATSGDAAVKEHYWDWL